MGSGVRVLGLDAEGLENFRSETKRNSGLYRAVDQRLQMVGSVTPRLPLWKLRVIQLLNIAPGRDRWRRRAALSPMIFRAETAIAERELRSQDGCYDVILQVYGLFALGRVGAGRRYAMYLDATAALTRREFPAATPISRRAFEQWFEMERETYRGAARLFPMSHWVGNSLIEDYGVDPERVWWRELVPVSAYVLREALGQGLPCIATATGGTREILAEGIDSVVVPPRDPGALATELIFLLADPGRAGSMGHAGHERMRTEATWDIVGDIIGPQLEAMARD